MILQGPVKRLLMSLFRTDVLLADGYNGDINEITKVRLDVIATPTNSHHLHDCW